MCLFTLFLAVILELCAGSPWSVLLDRSKRQTCNVNEFRCTSGECIDEYNLCDGAKDCADGSDETSVVCKPLSIDCPNFAFRCTYGACIDINKKCDGKIDCADGSDEDETLNCHLPNKVNYPASKSSFKGGCTLPKPPEKGSYSSPLCQPGDTSPACSQVPGTLVVQDWLLNFKCNHGYELPDKYLHAVCMDGKWLPQLPTCTRLCPKLVSLSVNVTCIYEGRPVDCDKPMRPGTKASGSCNENYYPTYDAQASSDIECQENGKWNESLFRCNPACGKANHKTSIKLKREVRSTPTYHGEYPWYVGLYFKFMDGEWEMGCGGTLINPHIVLTAAHCVYEEKSEKPIKVSEIKVGLGKYYKDWMKTEFGEEKRNVREIVVPTLYHGRKSNYARDIALIDLTQSVRITNFIMPACVDWTRQYTLDPGMVGTLTSWGNAELNKPSDVLVSKQLPFLENSKCTIEVPEGFQRFITPDKFCGGNQNGTGAATGDSGSGLTFVHEDGLHRVFGVTSTRAKYSYSTFTNVTNVDIMKWMSDQVLILNKLHSENVYRKMFEY